MLFWRGLTAFLVLPGFAAFVLPVLWMHYSGGGVICPIGLLIGLLGVIGLGWCVRDFYVAGKGTLAPWSPPQQLVVIGLYRYSRNPMYLSVLTILFGWTMATLSSALLIYGLVLAVGFHLRVVGYEEPWLQKRFAESWEELVRVVPRWLV